LLWAYSIEAELRAKQKAQARLALEICDQDPLVIMAVARLFWRDRKLDKARSWLNRAIALDKDLGDIWINLYAFELEHGTEAERETALKNCELADPHHGELWTGISKDVKNHQLSPREILQLGASRVNEHLIFTTYVSPKSLEQ
jgi:pre-mRNA-processing factor 6